jgi:endonuclease YncB( thermonuclease family)
MELERLQIEAKTSKLGLWADANPTPPWDWRKQQRALRQPSPLAY